MHHFANNLILNVSCILCFLGTIVQKDLDDTLCSFFFFRCTLPGIHAMHKRKLIRFLALETNHLNTLICSPECFLNLALDSELNVVSFDLQGATIIDHIVSISPVENYVPNHEMQVRPLTRFA